MKCSALFTISLALFSAAAVLAQSGSDRSSTGSDLERPSVAKSQDMSGPASNDSTLNVSSINSPPAAQPQEEEESSDSVPFYITAPSSKAEYTKGSTVTIEWINGIDEPFKIKILGGNNPTSMQPTKFSFTAQGMTGEYKWTVPEGISYGTYAFNFVFANKVGGKAVTQESYSEQFKIVPAGQASS
ncbi:unnamed protein product [Mucor hiemalis]